MNVLLTTETTKNCTREEVDMRNYRNLSRNYPLTRLDIVCVSPVLFYGFSIFATQIYFANKTNRINRDRLYLVYPHTNLKTTLEQCY